MDTTMNDRIQLFEGIDRPVILSDPEIPEDYGCEESCDEIHEPMCDDTFWADYGPDDDPNEYIARKFAQPTYYDPAAPAYTRTARAAQPINVTVNIPVCAPQPIKIRGCNGYCLSCPYRHLCGEVI